MIPSFSTSQGSIGGEEKLLYVIPNSLVPVQSVVKYVHKWSLDATSSGSAIIPTTKSDGVSFAFSPAPGSTLEFDVLSSGSSDISISSRLRIAGSNQQALSLVQFAAQNLIDSLANDIGALIMNMEEPSRANAAASRASSSTSFDVEDVEEYTAEEENAGLTRLPTDDDIMGLWEV
jgi:hypothetical protein